MMMTSVRKFRTLGVYELTHFGQKIRSSLFKLARVQNGSSLGDMKRLLHHECCFGINHWHYFKNHQLYMLDVVPKANQHKELDPRIEEIETIDIKGGKI
jgi:hypothetical protein